MSARARPAWEGFMGENSCQQILKGLFPLLVLSYCKTCVSSLYKIQHTKMLCRKWKSPIIPLPRNNYHNNLLYTATFLNFIFAMHLLTTHLLQKWDHMVHSVLQCIFHVPIYCAHLSMSAHIDLPHF